MSNASLPWQGNTVVLRNARLPNAALGVASGAVRSVDVRTVDGVVTEMAPSLPIVGSEQYYDCDGGLILPALVDVHTHLDKAHIWGRTENPDGTFVGALRAVGSDRQGFWSEAEIEGRMEFALRCAYAHGTAAIRTHLDSHSTQRAITWPIFAALKDRWSDRIELQAVALIGPDQMLDRDEVRDVARWVQQFGGLLGGAIAAQADAERAIANVVQVAGEFDLSIDLHCDETLDPAARSLLHLADWILKTGYAGSAQAGHCCSLATQNAETAARTIDRVAEAGVAVVTLPMCNMYLQDRQEANRPRTPRFRGVTLVKELVAAGVTLSVASDNTRDPFYAYGDLDMIEVFRELTRTAQVDHPSADAWDWLRAATSSPAQIAGFDYRGVVAVGAPADLLILRARTWSELHSRPQVDRIVVRAGQAIDVAPPDYRELDALIGVPG